MNAPLKVILAVLAAGTLLGATVVPAQRVSTRPKTGRQTRFADPARVRRLMAMARKLEPLHRRLPRPRKGEWLYENKETGQTFRQYLRSGPVFPTRSRHVIYVQPLGDFSADQRRILDLTAEFLGLYYGLETKVLKDLPLAIIPPRARRVRPGCKDEQILTGYVLENVLRPAMPEYGLAMIALTASDLWPGPGWNFVFGSASPRDRVGIWSLYRNGDPSAGQEQFRLCLLRTLKTAAHELGHMLSMRHCTAWRCNMCGSNSRDEADRRPIALCPECLAKLCWATGAEPVKRYGNLARFYKANGLADQAAFCKRAMAALAAGRATSKAHFSPPD